MTIQNIRVGGNIVNCCTQSVDVTDRHGVREPFFFIIMCKSSQVCIERSNWCLTFCHGFFCIITDDYEGKSRRGRNDLLGTAAHNVNLPVRNPHWLSKRSRNRIYHCHNAIFFEQWADSGNIIEHTAWCISMDNRCIFVIMMILKEVFQFLHIESLAVISGIEFRFSAVHGNKISESSAVNTIVQNEDTVTRFSHGSTGSFQSENPLSAKDEGFVFCVKKTADLFTGFLIKFYKICIKIRIGAFFAAGQAHIFGNLCRPRGHNFIHEIRSFLNFYFFKPDFLAATFSGAITMSVITAATPICTRLPGIEATGESGFP